MANGLLLPQNILSLHRKAAEQLLKKGDGDAALLYLCLLANGSAAALSWAPDRLERAHQILLTLDLADPAVSILPAPEAKLEDDRPPDYTIQDISQALANNGGFSSLVGETERLLGKVLSYRDQAGLYLILDYYGLPPEVILTLVSWCLEKTVKQYGPGRKPTLPQIKREAYKWYKAGVNTLEAADAYLRRQQQLGARGMEILALMDIRGRAPVTKEEQYLAQWLQEGYADELIRLAHERTLYQTGKRNWSYTNGILKSWHQQGLKTAAAVEAAESRRPAPPARPQPGTDKAPGMAADDLAQFFNKEG